MGPVIVIKCSAADRASEITFTMYADSQTIRWNDFKMILYTKELNGFFFISWDIKTSVSTYDKCVCVLNRMLHFAWGFEGDIIFLLIYHMNFKITINQISIKHKTHFSVWQTCVKYSFPSPQTVLKNLLCNNLLFNLS